MLTLAACVEPERRLKMLFPIPGISLSLSQLNDCNILVHAAALLLTVTRGKRGTASFGLGKRPFAQTMLVQRLMRIWMKPRNLWRYDYRQRLRDWEANYGRPSNAFHDTVHEGTSSASSSAAGGGGPLSALRHRIKDVGWLAHVSGIAGGYAYYGYLRG